MGHLLGVDLGTTAIKAALFDASGRRVAASTREYPLLTPAPQVVEQEAEVYWRAFRDALAAVLSNICRVCPETETPPKRGLLVR